MRGDSTILVQSGELTTSNTEKSPARKVRPWYDGLEVRLTCPLRRFETTFFVLPIAERAIAGGTTAAESDRWLVDLVFVPVAVQQCDRAFDKQRSVVANVNLGGHCQFFLHANHARPPMDDNRDALRRILCLMLGAGTIPVYPPRHLNGHTDSPACLSPDALDAFALLARCTSALEQIRSESFQSSHDSWRGSRSKLLAPKRSAPVGYGNRRLNTERSGSAGRFRHAQ